MFKIHSKYKPTGDQPKAIEKLVKGIINGEKNQVLLGVTGSGKTFTMANIIEKVNKPTLILAHNKTLAGQLYAEFKEFFPENHVEYFVSYYDYYQPEAYVAKTDTYIEKDASINDEIDELRHAATAALLKHKDVIVVASVSCIYGIGEIEEYRNKMLNLEVGQMIDREVIIEKLVEMLYERNNIDFKRGTFRVQGDIIDIIPINEHTKGIRIELFGDEIEAIKEFDPLTGSILSNKKTIAIFPASHFVTSENKLKIAIENIRKELEERLNYFKTNNKLLEHQRLMERTNYDLEMLSETGFCRGVENYSRHIALKKAGETPTTLIDFFGDDFLLFVDESHVTIPQVRGMYNGDRARKESLVEFGYYELEKSKNIVEQIIRPTGLLDPVIEVHSSKNQIDDLIEQIDGIIKKEEKILITTLTIRMAEELTQYLKGLDYKVAYLHTEIKTLERLKIIRDLRSGKYDILVGINLLREGLDIPEVSLVCIMDADKQGFLRSEKSLIQTIGRAARNSNGKVIMYADTISESMEKAIKETKRRREIQEEYNRKNNIIPTTIKKQISDIIEDSKKEEKMSKQEKMKLMIRIEQEMKDAAKNLDFERACELRDILFELKSE